MAITDGRRRVEALVARFGSADSRVARSLTELGGLLYQQADYGEARSVFERALAIEESLPTASRLDIAALHNNLGSVALAQGDYPYAQEHYGRSLAIRTTELSPDHPDLATGLNNLAALREAEGDYAEARCLYERALAIRETSLVPDHLLVAVSLNNLANVLEELGEYEEARTLYERSLAIREKTLSPDHPDVATALNNLAKLCREVGEYEHASVLYERALAIRAESLGMDHPRSTTSLIGLANVRKDLGDYAGARALYERASTARKSSGSLHPDVGVILNGFGSLLYAQGRLDAARSFLEQALVIVEQARGEEHPDVAKTLGNIGAVLHAQGDYAAARAFHERSLAITRRALGSEHRLVANGLSAVAGVLLSLGDLDEARRLFEQALSIRTTTLGPTHPDVAASLNHLGLLQYASGDLERAAELFERALSIRTETLGPDHPAVATCMVNLGAALEAQGEHAYARPLYERSLEARERALGPMHPSVSTTLNSLAGLLAESGERAEALLLYRRCLAIRESILGREHPHVASSLVDLTTVMADMGQHLEARRLLDRGFQGLMSHLGRTLSSLSEGEMHQYIGRLSEYQELRSSRFLRTQGGQVEDYERSLSWKGRVLRTVILGRDRLRRDLDAEDRQTLDRIRAIQRRLSRVVRSQETTRFLGAQEVRALVEERAALERRIGDRADGPLQGIPAWQRLRAALPGDCALLDFYVHREWAPALRRAGRVVEDGRWTEDRVTAWVTRPDSHEPTRVDLGPAKDIERAVRSFVRSVTGQRDGLLTDPPEANDKLRRLVWDPIAPQFRDVSTILLSPDGLLATLPWETLRGPEGRYLVEDHGYVYLADPTMLVEVVAREARPSDGRLLAVGDVDYMNAERPVATTMAETDTEASDLLTPLIPMPRSALTRSRLQDAWKPLPSTAAEVLTLAAFHERAFRGTVRTVLRGQQASEEHLKKLMPTASFLHFATHGYLQPDGWASTAEAAAQRSESTWEQPWDIDRGSSARRLVDLHPGLLSGLVCAGANADLAEDRDDGYLTAEEVGWLDLSACELAVLSACDTGLGRPQSGEGLLGLRRSFLLAGAKTVISSLWDVPDESTSALMSEFYANLWLEGMGRHEALRSAQLSILKTNRRQFGEALPQTWGGFVLDGDWR